MSSSDHNIPSLPNPALILASSWLNPNGDVLAGTMNLGLGPLQEEFSGLAAIAVPTSNYLLLKLYTDNTTSVYSV